MMRFSTFVVTAIVLLAPLQADSQTTWFKYEGNPVLAPGPFGAWDYGSVFPNRVIREGPLYVMWYTGGGPIFQTGRATSPDGVNWTKDNRNPVLQNGPALWDNVGSWGGYVIRTESQYKMWYTGDSIGGQTPRSRIGYASSADGVHWQKSPANPIIMPASWYAAGPACPSVLGPDATGGYRMWFQGDPVVHAAFQIGYATATDETTWTVRPDPVFSYGVPGTWDDDKVMAPKVLFENQRYEMFYCGERALNVDARTDIGHATSTDGLVWTRDTLNPVLRRGPGWDANDIYLLDVVPEQGVYHMWYAGTPTWINHHIGYAVSPKGLQATILPSPDVGWGATAHIVVRVDTPTALSFYARLESKLLGQFVDSLELFDDGAHGDSLAGDGIFANQYIAPSRNDTFHVNLGLRMHDTLRFNEVPHFTRFTVPVEPEHESIKPEKYSLDQNYPNPFNPSTTIRYAIPEKSRVVLTIFNTLGQEVATLFQGEKEAGYHEVKFEGSGLSSGVYFYKMTAGNYLATKKLVLLR